MYCNRCISSNSLPTASDEHKCNGVVKTLTLVRSSKGFIFGAYTSAAWSSLTMYKTDAHAFLISLVNEAQCPVKIRCSSPQHAVRCEASTGPAFGAGADLLICDRSNENALSLSSLGCSYRNAQFAFESKEGSRLLAGAYKFQISEIEVFRKC